MFSLYKLCCTFLAKEKSVSRVSMKTLLDRNSHIKTISNKKADMKLNNGNVLHSATVFRFLSPSKCNAIAMHHFHSIQAAIQSPEIKPFIKKTSFHFLLMWLLQVMGVVAFVSIVACSLKEKDNNNNINDNSERLTLQSQTAGGE